MRIVDEIAQASGWIAEERMARTSHALEVDGRVWLFDVVDWPELDDHVRELGEPAGVVQLLDRHNRDCASVAGELGVPHLVVPDAVPDSPFEVVVVKRTGRWRETALWWPAERTLVVAEAIGANRFFTAGPDRAGVHLLLRLSPPRDALGGFEPEHLLVGHGEGIHGADAMTALDQALDHARTGLPRLAVSVPALAVDAVRRRRRTA